MYNDNVGMCVCIYHKHTLGKHIEMLKLHLLYLFMGIIGQMLIAKRKK